MELIMSLYNATVGTATKLVTTTGNVACTSLDSVSVLVSAAHLQAERILLSSTISLQMDKDNADANGHARRQDAGLILAQRDIAHQDALNQDPRVLAAYNRIMGIS